MNIKRQIIIISLFFGIIALILIFVLIFLLFKGIKENSLEIISVKKELALFQNKTEGIESIRESYEEIEPDLKKIEEIFVDPEMPVVLIEFLERTARNSNLSIKISSVPGGFRLTLTGSFPNFLKFLEKTETSPHLIEIQNLTVEKSAQDVSTTLTVKVYTK